MPGKPGCGMYMKMISNCMEQHANAQMRTRDLTLAQSRMLLFLGDCPDRAATMKELETVFRSAQSTICGVVSRLEKKGLVESVPLPQDKRIKRIQLTPAGTALRSLCISDIRESDAWLISPLNAEEGQLFTELLRKIADGLRDDSDSSHPMHDDIQMKG